ncbi:MAG: hypothetical protein ABEK01_00050 [Candidatus Nanohaloarchaea archaeon]
MTVHNVNLSRARMAGRKSRAKKAMSILQEELERIEGDVSISGEVNAEIWKNGAEKPPSQISVEIEEVEGGKTAFLAAKEPETGGKAMEEPEEDGSVEEYEELLSGTVQEAKDAVREMEDPDYGKLLELEKEGKDRKTLKEFLENQ